MDEVAIFRSAKRRKFTRQPLGALPEQVTLSAGIEEDQEARPSGHADPPKDEDGDDDVDVSNLVRARRTHRKPVTGVQFSNTKAMHGEKEGASSTAAMVKTDQAPGRLIDITNRFVGSTGQAVNVDRHMFVSPSPKPRSRGWKSSADKPRVDFIDSELTRRRDHLLFSTPNNYSSDPQPPLETGSEPPNPPTGPEEPKTTLMKQNAHANPSSARQLTEVDLGSSAHDMNLARTQAAMERARTGQPPIEEAPKPLKPRKPRLGRDGKPMRPRVRKRRNSEDIARDALVEQVMHENRLDMYEEADLAGRKRQAAGVSGVDVPGDELDADDSDADERLAEQFRQNFIDAMAERQQRSKAASQPKGSGAGVVEAKGPKLGGSRSARAKMAQMQQQQQQQQAARPGRK